MERRFRRKRARGSGWVYAMFSAAAPSVEAGGMRRTFEGNVFMGAETSALAVSPASACLEIGD